MIGSLVVGVFYEHGLTYIGNVGTGFTNAMLADLATRLPLDPCHLPFDTDVPGEVARTARWTEPEFLGEIAYSGWTVDGHLRHPVWRGLRLDKQSDETSPDT
jgi:bifunctional non-homologous end joining protein LigD